MIRNWLDKKDAQKIISVLGGGENARFVGGCVRNTVLGIPVTDMDIATKHTPDKVMTLCAEQGIKTIPTGIDHGTVTALVEGQTFEITTLRRDVDTDGRHAKVAFSEDWLEDAQRRDFTMNTLLMDEKGNIYDPLECGIEDAQASRVIFVGDPSQRIREDVLRILRFFRFHAVYGEGTPDAAALKACAAHANLIPNLSKERITQEYLKILASDNARPTLELMQNHNVLSELTDFRGHNFDRLDLIGRLSGFEPDAREKYLILSGAQKKKIKAIETAIEKGCFDSEEDIQKTLYYFGRETTRAAYLRTIGKIHKKHVETIDFFNIPEFPLSGQDLLAKGIKQGPELGKKLKQLEKEWVDNGFKF
jgi:poly(A) polymerase